MKAKDWSALRAAWRLAVLAPVFAGGSVLVAASAALPIETRKRDRITRRMTALFARSLLAGFGVKPQKSGALSEEPALIVCNHLSWLDILVLLALVPDASFIAKSEIAAWPVIGRITKATGSIFIDRSRKRDLLRVIPAIQDSFASGRSVVLFGEGTTTDGTSTLPFRSSLFESAVRSGVRVVPVAFRPETGPQGPDVRTHVCWWGNMRLLPHLPKVAGTKTIQFRTSFGQELVSCGSERKELSARAHDSVSRQVVGMGIGYRAHQNTEQ